MGGDCCGHRYNIFASGNLLKDGSGQQLTWTWVLYTQTSAADTTSTGVQYPSIQLF